MDYEPSEPRLLDLAPPATAFAGRFYVPRGLTHPRPAVLIIGGSEGGLPSDRAQAAAASGIPSLAISYFKADGLPDSLREIPLEYFRHGLHWLSDQPGIDPRRLVVMGISRGSEAAMLAAIHFPELVAGVVALVPGNVVLCSWPVGAPAWMLNGRPLPYVSRFGPDCSSPDAFIRVESISGPVALVSAGRDQVWPSLAMARALAERRKAAGRGHPGDLLLEYPAASHNVAAFSLARDNRDRSGAHDAWPRILQFIRTVPSLEEPHSHCASASG